MKDSAVHGVEEVKADGKLVPKARMHGVAEKSVAEC